MVVIRDGGFGYRGLGGITEKISRTASLCGEIEKGISAGIVETKPKVAWAAIARVAAVVQLSLNEKA